MLYVIPTSLLRGGGKIKINGARKLCHWDIEKSPPPSMTQKVKKSRNFSNSSHKPVQPTWTAMPREPVNYITERLSYWKYTFFKQFSLANRFLKVNFSVFFKLIRDWWQKMWDGAVHGYLFHILLTLINSLFWNSIIKNCAFGIVRLIFGR